MLVLTGRPGHSTAITRDARLLAGAGRHLPDQLSAAQPSTVALARAGHDVDLALLRRLAPDLTDAGAALDDLVENGILRSRKARDDGPYRIAPRLKEAADVSASNTRRARWR
ncbi:MAG: hypothetical protein ACRDNS_36205 [Trebonia sp.]